MQAEHLVDCTHNSLLHFSLLRRCDSFTNQVIMLFWLILLSLCICYVRCINEASSQICSGVCLPDLCVRRQLGILEVSSR